MSTNMIVSLIVLMVIAIGAFVLTSNSSPGSKPTTSQNQTAAGRNSTSPSSGSTTSASPSASDKVEIRDFAFNPANITVKKGTTVTWTNQDTVAHNVVETDGKAGPNSKLLQKGESYSFTFDTVGKFQYFCSVHPNMIGSVTVTE